MLTDKVFQSIWHLRLTGNGLLALLAIIDMCHDASRVAKNAIVMSRSVEKNVSVATSSFQRLTLAVGQQVQ